MQRSPRNPFLDNFRLPTILEIDVCPWTESRIFEDLPVRVPDLELDP